MDTIHLQEPDGGNGSGGNGHAVVACPCEKKLFASREEAEQFETANRKRFPNQPIQYAYKCPDCPFFHLTSKPPEAFALGRSNLKRLEALATAESSKAFANRRPRGETQAEVKRLSEQGLSNAAIAMQVGISSACVAYHRKKIAGTEGGNGGLSRHAKASLTLPELDERQRKLQHEFEAQMRELDRQKERLAEATKLTVCECQDGKALFIKFGHDERMSIPKEKVGELADSLMKRL